MSTPAKTPRGEAGRRTRCNDRIIPPPTADRETWAPVSFDFKRDDSGRVIPEQVDDTDPGEDLPGELRQSGAGFVFERDGRTYHLKPRVEFVESFDVHAFVQGQRHTWPSLTDSNVKRSWFAREAASGDAELEREIARDLRLAMEKLRFWHIDREIRAMGRSSLGGESVERYDVAVLGVDRKAREAVEEIARRRCVPVVVRCAR